MIEDLNCVNLNVTDLKGGILKIKHKDQAGLLVEYVRNLYLNESRTLE